MDNLTCAEVQDAAAEYALDILSPVDRSAVAAHMIRCPGCRADVETMKDSADRLLDLVPGTEPPLGFDHRVLDRLGVAISPNRRRFRLIATMAAVVALILGSTFGVVINRNGHTNRPALAAAEFVAQGRTVGEVYLYAGQPPWLEMSVKNISTHGKVTCELVTSSGVVALGSFELVKGAGYWGASDRVGFAGVSGVRIVDDSGRVLASATFA